jgi:hypothetical protein
MSLFKPFRTVVCTTFCLLGVGTTQAVLIDRGGGMIYDSDKNITWYDFTTPTRTTWQAQMTWASNLTVTFGGTTFDDWRLPIEYPDAYTGLWCVQSEIGHLYYTELGNSVGGTKTGPFKNLKSGYYWTGTEFTVTSDRSNAWCFFMLDGMNGYTAKYDPRYAMAVRDGDVGPVAGDVDGDGHVDVSDLLYLVEAFGSVPGDANYDPRCDFNGDESVDVSDLLDLVLNFGL